MPRRTCAAARAVAAFAATAAAAFAATAAAAAVATAALVVLLAVFLWCNTKCR